MITLTGMAARNTYQFPFSRYPAVRIAMLLIIGILAGNFWSLSVPTAILLFVFMLFLQVLVEEYNRRKTALAFTHLSTLIFLCSIVAFGVLCYVIQQSQKDSPIVSLIKVSEWEEVTVNGQIISISETAAGKERWEFEVVQTIINGITSGDKYKLRVLAESSQGVATMGDLAEFTGTLIPVSEKRNPLDFDYKEYLLSQGIVSQIRLESLHSITSNKDKSEMIWWREQALNLTEKLFDERTAPIAKALLLGYKQDLDFEDKTAFARTGLSHVMAVSGLHVGFIIAPFWLIIPLLWTKKYGKTLGLISLILILGLYAGITGLSSSVMRASVMAAFLTYAKLFHKINDSINVTAASAVVLLIINPAQLFEIGFQLSYSAVFIILLVLPVIQQKLPYWLQFRWYGIPVMAVIVCLVVQFGLYPLQVFYFGEISLISPIANALFVPFLGIVIPLSLLALLVSIVFPAAGLVLNFPSLWFLKGLAAFVEYSSQLEWAWTQASSSGVLFLLWIFLISLIATLNIPALRWKMAIGCLSVLCFMNAATIYSKLQPQELEITFFDVGQGDAALLKTPSGKHILLDAGVWSPGYNSGKYVILPHLRKAGVEKLDAIILSHPHADHIGGILDIIEEIPVDAIYNSGYEYDSNLYHSYLQKAGEKKIPVKDIKAGEKIEIDPAALILALGPDGIIHNSDPNEHSVVLNIIYGETEFLFTGDAGEHQERRLIESYGSLLDTDLLKVGHHGSRTSSSLSFLNAVTPEMAVISLAENNKFRHPHPEALGRLATTRAEMLFTSKEKALIFSSDGKKIQRKYWD